MKSEAEKLFDDVDSVTPEMIKARNDWVNASEQTAHPRLMAAIKKIEPFRVHTIREGAPYSTTLPGCLGRVVGYTREGEAIFAMFVPAIGKPMYARGVLIEDVPLPLKVYVDCRWLMPVTRTQALKLGHKISL